MTTEIAISVESIKQIAIEAGKKILEIYEKYADLETITERKADNSPLTLADQASHTIISERLLSLYPQIPLLSEEGKHTAYEIRKEWPKFWLVDPLDGTKEFIKRNGEFTVNIALIEKNIPVLGVIYAPVWNLLYYGIQNQGSFKETPGQPPVRLQVNNKQNLLTAVGSRSHADPAEAEELSKYDISGTTSIGSSLKFCLIAEGKADIYYRYGPTMEWDTAAGQAIVAAAGGQVLDASGNIFTYNKPSLLNGSFLCQGF
jgi:3'(2'), 5'-bisphosphate nucleotidase